MAAEDLTKFIGEAVDPSPTPGQGEKTLTPVVPSRPAGSASAAGGIVSGQENVLNRIQEDEERREKKDLRNQEPSDSGGSKKGSESRSRDRHRRKRSRAKKGKDKRTSSHSRQGSQSRRKSRERQQKEKEPKRGRSRQRQRKRAVTSSESRRSSKTKSPAAGGRFRRP